MGYYDNEDNSRVHRRINKNNITIFICIIFLISNIVLLSILLNTEGKSDAANTFEQSVNLNVEDDTTKAISKTINSVVGIVTFSPNSIFYNNQENVSGSGVVYKKENDTLYVVTNHHVINNADKIEVQFSNGKREIATIIGSDQLTDIAVLKVTTSIPQEAAEFGDSESLNLGEPVIAIGNPLGFLNGTVTKGIISGKNRSIPIDINNDGVVDWNSDVIQTDASINPGNSGGALINISGQVVGINSSKIAQESVEGIGFSIPINTVKDIINQLETYGKVKRPYIGFDIAPLSEVHPYHRKNTLKLPDKINSGVVIQYIYPDSPADKANLHEMDVITHIDNKEIEQTVDLRSFLYKKAEGDNVNFTVFRRGEKMEVSVTLDLQ